MIALISRVVEFMGGTSRDGLWLAQASGAINEHPVDQRMEMVWSKRRTYRMKNNRKYSFYLYYY